MSMDVKVFSKINNDLTEYSGDYKRINPHILSGYYGLPKSFSKLSMILFGFVMKTKMYKEKAFTKDINEEKRIYNDIPITIEDILKEWNHEKYSSGHDMMTDVGNMNKRIREIDENNIFYCWKYRSLYMFIMERYLCIWKFYNISGKVLPKTIKKVSVIGNDMILCMTKNVRKIYGDVDKSDIEKSFGTFMNRLIDKTNHLVSTEIIKWDGKQDIFEYLYHLNDAIKNLDDHNGLVVSNDIFNKFPYSISKKIQTKIKEELDMKIHSPDKNVKHDLIPSNPNLIRNKRKRKPNTTLIVSEQSSDRPIAYEYSGTIDPFADARQFVRYYHAFLQQCAGGNIKFDNYASDAVYATKILDLLIENGRSSNKIFLDSWLKYFHDYGLKGQKSHKVKYTSLKTLMETFDIFNGRYLENPV